MNMISVTLQCASVYTNNTILIMSVCIIIMENMFTLRMPRNVYRLPTYYCNIGIDEKLERNI